MHVHTKYSSLRVLDSSLDCWFYYELLYINKLYFVLSHAMNDYRCVNIVSDAVCPSNNLYWVTLPLYALDRPVVQKQ